MSKELAFATCRTCGERFGIQEQDNGRIGCRVGNKTFYDFREFPERCRTTPCDAIAALGADYGDETASPFWWKILVSSSDARGKKNEVDVFYVCARTYQGAIEKALNKGSWNKNNLAGLLEAAPVTGENIEKLEEAIVEFRLTPKEAQEGFFEDRKKNK